MLTIILFILGLFFLLARKYASLLTVILILLTTFLQLQIKANIFTLSAYNTSDFGILLFLLFFIQIALNKGICFNGKVQRVVTLFLIFLLLNGFFDIIYNGTSVSDVIKYLKNWIPLSIVYIYPYIRLDYAIKSLNQIYKITLLICLFITVSMVLKQDLGILYYSSERGIKPPPDCMWFAPLAFMNVWGKSKSRSIIETFIFVLPVILSLKMTYAVTIFLIFGFIILMKKNISTILKTGLFVFMLCTVSIVLYINSDFSERLESVALETNDISQEENSGNFAYRILHAQERWNYIKKDPVMLTRGFGYLHEKNLKKTLFQFGTNNGEQQLETGDIAWSLFFIRLGILGIFFYLMMYLSILKQYYMKRQKKICLIFASMMITYLIFTSLGNCIVTYSYFFIYPILFININREEYNSLLVNKYSLLIK